MITAVSNRTAIYTPPRFGGHEAAAPQTSSGQPASHPIPLTLNPAAIEYQNPFFTVVNDQNQYYLEYPNSYGSVNVIPVVRKNGELFVHLLETRRPSMKGKITLELAGGNVGDEDHQESWEAAARRELTEETGYKARSLWSIPVDFNFEQRTSRVRRFMLADCGDARDVAERHLDLEEQDVIVDSRLVPVKTLQDDFLGWAQQMAGEGYIVYGNVSTAAAMLNSPEVRSRLNGFRLDKTA
ncbi:MAG: NUDIX domain-containing protein [Candidatus Melainabacteria bacterium]